LNFFTAIDDYIKNKQNLLRKKVKRRKLKLTKLKLDNKMIRKNA